MVINRKKNSYITSKKRFSIFFLFNINKWRDNEDREYLFMQFKLIYNDRHEIFLCLYLYSFKYESTNNVSNCQFTQQKYVYFLS